MSYLFNKSIKINPQLSPKLIESLQLLQSTIQTYIPAYPSYLKQNDDGTYSVPLGAIVDAKKLLKNENLVNYFDYAEDFIPGVPYEVYELGEGYSVTSFGSIYDGNTRVFSPKRLNEAYVDLVDFKNDIVSIRLKYESLMQQGLSVRLPSSVLGIDLNKLRSKVTEFLINDEFIEFITTDPNDPNAVTVDDLINESGGTNGDGSDIAQELTSKTYLTAQVVTEETSPNKRNYLHLLFLLLLGGGSIGVAPLPNANDKCAKYYKPSRNGISVLKRKDYPSDGHCHPKSYYTYHPKMYSASNPSGSKTSIFQIVYRILSSMGIFNLNLNKSYIYIGFKVSKWSFGKDWDTTNGVSIGGALETSICRLQEKVSEEISSYFATRTYIRLPVLNDKGHGFCFSKNEELTEGSSNMPRTEQYFTGNYKEEEYFVDVYDKTLPSMTYFSKINVNSSITLEGSGQEHKKRTYTLSGLSDKSAVLYPILNVLQMPKFIYQTKPANKKIEEFLSDSTIFDIPVAEKKFKGLFAKIHFSASSKQRSIPSDYNNFFYYNNCYYIAIDNPTVSYKRTPSYALFVNILDKNAKKTKSFSGYNNNDYLIYSIGAGVTYKDIKQYVKQRNVKRTPIMATRVMPYYERLQVDLFSRVNFARIYEYIYLEKLYTQSVDSAVELKSILEKVVSIYNSPNYGLKVLSSKFPFTYSFAKSYYDSGFHLLYGENLPNDNFVLSFQVGDKMYSVNSIDYIIKMYLTELKICDGKMINLELFDANKYSNSRKYIYK